MSNMFTRPVDELIKIRNSVRNYDNSPLSEEIINKIENFISKVENTFNQKIRIKLIKIEIERLRNAITGINVK